jgi:light-regulated signal transduction histidine kinase (bacteriophytochrome)
MELQQFAYAVSHDLQEPLRTVTSYIQLLEKRFREKLGDDGREFIAFAVDASRRMQAMIRDLLEYSRVQTREAETHPVDLDRVVAVVRRNLATALDEAGGGLSAEDGLPIVPADEAQLVRLFQNLIGNAIKYRHPDRAPEVTVAAERRGAHWLFRVRDNGIGIDPKYFDRIFGVFTRLHTREEYEGTGIGLALCKRIVERHGGTIWVESEPGSGSTFLFTLLAAD